MIDGPIHLAEYKICNKQPHTDASVVVPVWITQSTLDGLQALINYFRGVEAAGKPQPQGHVELIMFYRTLRESIRKAENSLPENNAGGELNPPM